MRDVCKSTYYLGGRYAQAGEAARGLSHILDCPCVSKLGLCGTADKFSTRTYNLRTKARVVYPPVKAYDLLCPEFSFDETNSLF